MCEMPVPRVLASGELVPADCFAFAATHATPAPPGLVPGTE